MNPERSISSPIRKCRYTALVTSSETKFQAHKLEVYRLTTINTSSFHLSTTKTNSDNCQSPNDSSSDLELTSISSIPIPPEPVKTTSKIGTKEAPPDYNEATPPPSYPASFNRDLLTVEDEATPGKRTRWHRRHPWWCSFFILLLLAAIILGAVLGSMMECTAYCCVLHAR